VEKKGGDFGHQLPCQTDRSLEQTCPEKWLLPKRALLLRLSSAFCSFTFIIIIMTQPNDALIN
jgi:hypothetical protein